jgi:hypothetical protein
MVCGINFPDIWSEIDIIEHLQRRILVYSILYYEYDKSPISDERYDQLAHALAELMRNCLTVSESRYHYVFYDYDGSTGYFLAERLTKEDRAIIMSIVSYGLNKI